MTEKYYAGDRGLKPDRCYLLCEDLDPDFSFATDLLDRDNIRWTVWCQRKVKQLEYLLYRDSRGLVLRGG